MWCGRWKPGGSPGKKLVICTQSPRRPTALGVLTEGLETQDALVITTASGQTNASCNIGRGQIFPSVAAK